MQEKNTNIWPLPLAGACALFVGIGLCRFAYTPLIPAMIQQTWITQAGAGYLGAINLFGYLLGACLCRQVNKRFDKQTIIKVSFIISIAGLGLCAIDLGFIWFALWRFAVGVTGAWLMIMTPSIVLKHVPAHYKGRMAGVVFTGIGLGVIVAGSFFPALAKFDIAVAWGGAALLALFATLISWSAFSNIVTTASHIRCTTQSEPEKQWVYYPQVAVILLGIAYMAYGVGMVPHTLLLVDHVQTQLSLTLVASGMFWTLFGIGAAIGPLCVGTIADKMGLYKSLMFAFSTASLSILVLVIHHSIPSYALSAFSMGMLVAAIPSLVSSRVLDLVGVVQHPLYWGKVTLYCAISQAVAAHVMSYFIEYGVPYMTCFVIASLVFLFGFIAVVFARSPEPEESAAV